MVDKCGSLQNVLTVQNLTFKLSTMQVIDDCSNHIIIDDQILDHHYRQQKNQQNQSETLGFDLILHLYALTRKLDLMWGLSFPKTASTQTLAFDCFCIFCILYVFLVDMPLC